MLEHLESRYGKRESTMKDDQRGTRPQSLAFAMFCPYSGDAAILRTRKNA